MKRIHKVDTRSQATAYGWTAVWLALPFVAIGAFTALAGFGFAPLPGKANAPLWVIGCVGLSFAAAGALLLTFGVRGVLNRRRRERRQARGSFEPWFDDHTWDPRGVSDNTIGRLLHGAGMTVFLAVFLVPFNWWAFVSDVGGLFIMAIVGFFDLVLLALVGVALRRLAQALRFGVGRLHFRHFPFAPGGPLRVAFAGRSLDRLRATLRFVEERFESRGSGKNRSTQLISYEHFSLQQELAATAGMPEIEIAFDIPDNAEWVTAMSGQPVRYWELVIDSEQPGVDFHAAFPLPVYARQ